MEALGNPMWFRMCSVALSSSWWGRGERLPLRCFTFSASLSATVILLPSKHMPAGGVSGEAALSMTRSGRHPRRKP